MIPAHLIKALESLPSQDRTALEKDIQTQDFDLLDRLFREVANQTPVKADARVEPMPFAMAETDPSRSIWQAEGEKILAAGQAAAFLVAGGQGSRLGFEGPKGACRIGLPSGKSIFHIQAERLLHLERRYGKAVPWCVMTSPLNHADTVAHFEEHSYFGLQKDMIRFFPQGMICALDTQGRALRESPARLALVPDGNGGCFRALAGSGTLAWLEGLGVKYVFLYGVDNVLARICDPLFLGALAARPDMASASKVVPKGYPEEKVGIFAMVDGQPGVIEYSDLPADLRDQRTEDGNLAYDGANIVTHLFRLEALGKLRDKPLPWHAAFKKVAFCTDDGQVTQPAAPNAWKFEQFMFDAFPVLGSMLPVGVGRAGEFAPVKNASGDDSPESARRMLGILHRGWLKAAGAPVRDDCLYEISPLLSYAGEGLSADLFARERSKGILEFAE